MKNTVIINAEELKKAALHILLEKPQFYGKYVSTVEFVFNQSDPNPMRQMRCEVVLFDTEGGARRYLESKDETEDQPAGGEAATPADPNAATDLEGSKHG